MTEDEYLAATNLTKIRIASNVLRDCLFMTDPDATCRSVALTQLSEIEDRLANLNKTDPET